MYSIWDICIPWEEGSIALYTAYTVDTVDTVYTVDTVNTVYTVHAVDTVYTVYTIETALHFSNISTYGYIVREGLREAVKNYLADFLC